MNYRIDLAGGWLDQPFVLERANSIIQGKVIVANIEALPIVFSPRSGMAVSTRLIGSHFEDDLIKIADLRRRAQFLFALDNQPVVGKNTVSGSQDAYGIILPGINCLTYTSESYLPGDIRPIGDPSILEKHLWFNFLGERSEDYNPFNGMRITSKKVISLADAAEEMEDALMSNDMRRAGEAMTQSFFAQQALFPETCRGPLGEKIEDRLSKVQGVHGYKLSGAGGGGYLVAICRQGVVLDDHEWFQVKLTRP